MAGAPLIDELLPRFDERSRYARAVDAPPEAALAAVRGLRVNQLPLTRALMTLRGVPNLLAGKATLERGDAAVIDAMLAFGFVLLADRERELVLAAVGRFWRPVSALRPVDGASGFRAFAEPGHARAVMDFHAVPDRGACVVITETRIQATDEESRRLFRRYWRLISAASGLTRHEMLRAAARRAERG